jgi:hypothetical protein
MTAGGSQVGRRRRGSDAKSLVKSITEDGAGRATHHAPSVTHIMPARP